MRHRTTQRHCSGNIQEASNNDQGQLSQKTALVQHDRSGSCKFPEVALAIEKQTKLNGWGKDHAFPSDWSSDARQRSNAVGQLQIHTGLQV